MAKGATIAAVCFVALSHCGTSTEALISGADVHVKVQLSPLFVAGWFVAVGLLRSFYTRQPLPQPAAANWTPWKAVAGAHLVDLMVFSALGGFPPAFLEMALAAKQSGHWSWEFVRTDVIPSDPYVLAVGLLGFPFVSLLWGWFWRTGRQSPGAYLAGIRPEIGDHSILRLALLGWLEGVSFLIPGRTGPGSLLALDYRLVTEPGSAEAATPIAKQD